MELIPTVVAERIASLSRREGLWRGLLIGGCVGILFGALCAVLIIRGVLS
jgi:ABC-type uncharacterized transport system permease subunit